MKRLKNIIKAKGVIGFCYFFKLLIFTFIFVFGIGKSLKAQTESNKLVNFNVENQSISSSIDKLAAEYNLNISYNASQVELNKKITYSAKAKTTTQIFHDLLANTGLTFKRLNNHVVIYKDPEFVNSDTTTVLPIVIESRKYDTVYQTIIDTILVKDTVINWKTDTLVVKQTDTLRFTDTVFINKRRKNRNIDYKNSELVRTSDPREDGMSVEIFGSLFGSVFPTNSENGNFQFRNYSLGASVTKIYNKFDIEATLKLTHFSDKFNNSYSISEGGFYQKDTIEEYYTIIENDTSWFYVTDSTWLPVDNKLYSFDVNNRIGYLDFGLAGLWKFYSSKNINFYAKLGVQTSILIYKSGTAITDAENKPEGIDFAGLEFRNALLSVNLALGSKYRLSKNIDLKSEIYYFNSLHNSVKNYPINSKIKGVGLSLGLVWYF